MMKKALLPSVLVLLALSLQAVPDTWPEFQRDLGIQAAQFKELPEYQAPQPKETRSYEVGDTQTFWSWNLSIMPPSWIQTPATCRAVGAHCYLFVADSEWNLHMDQTDVDAVMFRLEQSTVNDPTRGAIEMDIDLFGPIPDEIDNDPRLIVFYSALGSFQGTSFDGNFSPYNQVTEAQAQQMNPPGHSNECEMIYMTCHPLDPVAPVRLSVLAHELQHLIHWGQDANEETWLNEGCSELAMVVYGVPDPITGFPSNPDNSLIAWNQTFADYVKVMLFFTYLQEHYDATGLISDLVADPSNGLVSLNQQLAIHHPDMPFPDIFKNWGTANIIDEVPPQHPLWGYAQLDLPNFSMTVLSPVPELNNQTIQPYATDYLKYACAAEGERLFTLTSDNPVSINSVNFGYTGQCLGVTDEGTGDLFELAPPLSNFADHVCYVLANPFPNSVTYSLITAVANDDPLSQAVPKPMLSCHPNPFLAGRGSLRIEVRGRDQIAGSVQIYNSRGQLVRRLEAMNNEGSGQMWLDWDARNEAGNPVSGGIYLLRYGSGTRSAFQKLCLIR